MCGGKLTGAIDNQKVLQLRWISGNIYKKNTFVSNAQKAGHSGLETQFCSLFTIRVIIWYASKYKFLI